MSRYLRTAAKWAFSVWLTAALAFAPAVGAFAGCMPKSHSSMSHLAKSPCDTPCKHCDGDEDRTQCKSHCAGLAVSIVPSTIELAPLAQAARVGVHRQVSPIAFARPPDTPPPRSFPV